MLLSPPVLGMGRIITAWRSMLLHIVRKQIRYPERTAESNVYNSTVNEIQLHTLHSPNLLIDNDFDQNTVYFCIFFRFYLIMVTGLSRVWVVLQTTAAVEVCIAPGDTLVDAEQRTTKRGGPKELIQQAPPFSQTHLPFDFPYSWASSSRYFLAAFLLFLLQKRCDEPPYSHYSLP